MRNERRVTKPLALILNAHNGRIEQTELIREVWGVGPDHKFFTRYQSRLQAAVALLRKRDGLDVKCAREYLGGYRYRSFYWLDKPSAAS